MPQAVIFGCSRPATIIYMGIAVALVIYSCSNLVTTYLSVAITRVLVQFKVVTYLSRSIKIMPLYLFIYVFWLPTSMERGNLNTACITTTWEQLHLDHSFQEPCILCCIHIQRQLHKANGVVRHVGVGQRARAILSWRGGWWR